MGKLYDNLKNHFENTPQEELDRERKEIESLNDIGSDVTEYANWIEDYKSKIESKYFELFKKARQEDKEKLIAEACRWLEENIGKDVIMFNGRKWTSRYNFINNFRKAMEDLK